MRRLAPIGFALILPACADAGDTPIPKEAGAMDAVSAFDATPSNDGAAADVVMPTSDASDSSTMAMDSGQTGMCSPPAIQKGGLTQYDPTALGNCAVPWPSNDMYAALATVDYDAPSPSGSCGKCIEITGPTNMVAVVTAVDQCPTNTNPKCTKGHLDLSHTAFKAVVPPNYVYGGEVPNNMPISWKFVKCPVQGNIVYHFKEGTNPYWIAVQVRNARYGIKKMRYRVNNQQWTDFTDRTDAFAFFLVQNLNATKLDLEAIDEYDHVVSDNAITIGSNTDVPSASQFPACP
jgi:expansin (peptidoglycan-binding protein)